MIILTWINEKKIAWFFKRRAYTVGSIQLSPIFFGKVSLSTHF